MNIVKDKVKLSKPVPETKLTSKEIDLITKQLTEGLEKFGGIGLSANQIGLNVRACIINVKEPLVLINPKIVEMISDAVAYAEQCLSIDKTMRKPIKTIRSKKVTVECDNLGTVIFSPDNEFGDWKDSNEFFNDLGLLECVCAQHEIDHLNGVLITDTTRRYSETVTKAKTYGRNEMVMVKLADGKTEFIKYKKAQSLLANGATIV